MTLLNKDARHRKPEIEGGWQPVARRLLKSTGLGFGLFAALTLIAAAVCMKLDAAQDRLHLVAIPLAGVAAFTAGYLNVRPVRKQGMVFGMLAAAALYLPVLVTSLLVSGAAPGMNAVVLLLLMLLCGTVGGICAANRSGGAAAHRKSVKTRNR